MTGKSKFIVALHGGGMHAGVWGSLAGALPLPLQALSLPGHGKTAGPLLPDIEKMAAWVRAKLDSHTPQSIVLAGHSMGALVALEAAQHPAVSSLVLMGAAARMPVHAELLRQAQENPDAAADLVLKWSISPVNPQISVIRSVLKEQMQAVVSGALFNDLKACDEYLNGEAAATAVRLPTLVVSGLDDKMTRPAQGKELAEMISQGEFHVLADCGHMPMVEKPAEMAREISSFIDALAG